MNLRSLRIGARLGIGFALVLALLALVVIGGNVTSDQSMKRLTRGLEGTTAKGALAEKMKSALLEGAVAMRNIGLQADVAATQGEEAKVKEQRKRYAQARDQLSAIGLSDAEKELLANIAKLDQEMEKPLVEAVGQALLFDTEAAAKVITTRIDPVSRKSLAEINKLVDIQQAAAREVLEQTAVSARQMHTLLYVLGAIALAIGVACSLVITRGITHPLRDAVSIARRVAAGDLSSDFDAAGKDETADLLRALKEMAGSLQSIVAQVRRGTEVINVAAKEIAHGNQDLSSRTEHQASSLEETASSMEELTSTVKHNAENARQANQLAAGASEVAVKGGRVVGQVVETMGGISDSSKKIADIIGVIDGIAFQTNILALNAAVEAARAGEQGRGFAVVASEVRSLAQRSAAAAKEIKTLIVDSVDKVGAGTKLVDEAGKTMDEIVTAVKRVTDIMSEITAASQEQSSGIEQVNQAITQMDEVTQQNAALVEEAAAASESLDEQAKNLATAVAVFRLHDGNNALSGSFDFDKAVEAHLGWSGRLRNCIDGSGEALDPAVVSADDRCPLGQWIYGDAKRYSARGEYSALRSSHKDFHQCAGHVVKLCNAGDQTGAHRALSSEFAAKSKETIERLYDLKHFVEGRVNVERRGPKRPPNVARLPVKPAVKPAAIRSTAVSRVKVAAAAGGDEDKWEEF